MKWAKKPQNEIFLGAFYFKRNKNEILDKPKSKKGQKVSKRKDAFSEIWIFSFLNFNLFLFFERIV
ncbi:MAG: hypothetical protein WCR04_12035 [Fibrobacteraceae bacterium]